MWREVNIVLTVTLLGIEYAQLNKDERSLRMHILQTVWSFKNSPSFSDLVDAIRFEHEEYKNTEVKIFAKYTAELVKEGLLQYESVE